MDILPKILIVDDLFGRILASGLNEERAGLCAMYGLRDITGDQVGKGQPDKVLKPIADAVFYKGQVPTCAVIGNTVENDLEGTIDFIRKGWTISPDNNLPWSLVLLDLCFYTGRVTSESNQKTAGMPEGREGDDNPRQYFGLQLLDRLHYELPDLPIVILSSKPREEVSRAFTSKGALGFLAREDSKSPDLLKDLLIRHGLIPDFTGQIVGHSKALLLALRATRRASADCKNVLIRGERGTGKELLAHYINNPNKQEKNRPLVIVNSGTLSPTLYSSELFGHSKGSFTGATGHREGLIVQADKGDLFLDEIGNMSADVQVGILRVIEHHAVVPVGGTAAHDVDVRFISATNEDIEENAASGRGFRMDLLDRLREGGTIFLPPLRDRREDIPFLTEKFIRQAETEVQGALRREIDPIAIDKIINFDWPGNVRDMRNTIFAAVRNHPDVEYMVPDHIQFPDQGGKAERPTALTIAVPKSSAMAGSVPSDMQSLLQALAALPVEGVQPETITRILPKILLFVANLLKAGLVATRKPSLEYPAGKLLIHPAVKYLTGDPKLTASSAADLIKRIRNLCPETKSLFETDPVLKEAYGTAVKLRPGKSK